jgi:hypothetical protein
MYAFNAFKLIKSKTMEANQVIVKLRSTLFIPRFIGHTATNKEKYCCLLKDGKAEPVEAMLNPFGYGQVSLEENSSWQISNGTYKIVFLPNRIDFLCAIISTDDSIETLFIEETIRIFREIMNKEDVQASRFAYAPILALDNDENFNNSMFFNTFISKNSFMGESAIENNIRTLYRKPIDIGGNALTINYIINFSTGNKSVADEDKTYPALLVEIDINTKPKLNVSYDAVVLKAFFEQVKEWRIELLNTYL